VLEKVVGLEVVQNQHILYDLFKSILKLAFCMIKAGILIYDGLLKSSNVLSDYQIDLLRPWHT